MSTNRPTPSSTPITRRHMHLAPNGRCVVGLSVPAWRLFLSAGLILAGLGLGLLALLAGQGEPAWSGPGALAVVFAGVVLASWPSAPVVIDPEARQVRLPRGARVPFETVRGVVLFTAVREEEAQGTTQGACETGASRLERSVYLLTTAPARKRSRLRREIARWGARRRETSTQALAHEAEAAAARHGDAATLHELMNGGERLVAHRLSCPLAWTLARHVALTLKVPLIHHAGHLALLEPSELRRPLVARLRNEETPLPRPLAALAGEDPSSAPPGLDVERHGTSFQAQWFEPRFSQPNKAAWWLASAGLGAGLALLLLFALAEGMLAEWNEATFFGALLLLGFGLLGALAGHVYPAGEARSRRLPGRWRTRWGLVADTESLTVWRGSPERDAMQLSTAELTDLLVVECHGKGLAVTTAEQYVLLPMAAATAHWLREQLRAHLAQLAPVVSLHTPACEVPGVHDPLTTSAASASQLGDGKAADPAHELAADPAHEQSADVHVSSSRVGVE